MAQDPAYIRQFFEAIRDERGIYQNTATRIGTAFLLLLDYLLGNDHPYLRKDIDDAAAGHITFSNGFTAVLDALFGTYVRSQQSNSGAKITPQGLGDFVDLKVIGQVLGSLTVQDVVTALDVVFNRSLKSPNARKGFTDGYGVFIDALEGLIQTDGLEVRGFMRVLELIINKLKLMTSDYSFTEGGTIEHVSTNELNGVLTLTMHKEHDNDLTPFDVDDIVYAKVNNLLEKKVENADHSVPDYYTVWMRITAVDREENTLTAILYDGMQGQTPIVQGGRNFSPCGTEVANSAWYADGDYDCSINITRHGNVTNTERQQAWVLSTTDKRLSFFWGVDKPIIEDRNYALCLGILPDLANLPSTRDRSKPSLYVDTIFYDHSHKANFPAKEVKEDRGQWTDTPTAEYNGQAVSDPYHYRHINQPTWLTYRAMSAYQSLTDEQLLQKINVEFKADLETSRVWRYGILWECLTEATTEEPGFGCQHWQAVAGETMLNADFAEDYQLYDPDNFHATLTLVCRYGQEDITGKLLQQDIAWTRYTEDAQGNHRTASDTIWNNANAYSAWATGRQVLTLRQADLDAATEFPSLVRFRCEVTVRDGRNGDPLWSDTVEMEYNP